MSITTAPVADPGGVPPVWALTGAELLTELDELDKLHRADRGAVRRDLRLANALPKYTAVSESLLGHSADPDPDSG